MKSRWIFLLSLAFVVPSVFAADETITVTEQGISAVVRIVHEVPLEYDETYESPYIDVRDYREATFYVLPAKALNEDKDQIRYQLDAFFSVDAQLTTVRGFGGKKVETDSGYQEFGDSEKFVQLTTGVTNERVLHTQVYGPFVRVVLKSLTADERRGYQIVAYLTR